MLLGSVDDTRRSWDSILLREVSLKEEKSQVKNMLMGLGYFSVPDPVLEKCYNCLVNGTIYMRKLFSSKSRMMCGIKLVVVKI